MKTGEADAEPNAEMLNAMVKDPHKSKEDKPMKDMNAMYMKSDVRADVEHGGADMAKLKMHLDADCNEKRLMLCTRLKNT